jgi:hypothetical protein
LSPGFPVDNGDEITITGKFIEIVQWKEAY